jgi:hypothetical protein
VVRWEGLVWCFHEALVLGPSLPNSETVFVFDPEQKPKTISRSLPYQIWF